MEYIDNDLDALLKQWGLWARSNPHSLNYPSITPFRRLYTMGSDNRCHITITEDEALRIDRAMAAMNKAQKTFFEATAAFYLQSYTYSEIGELMGINRKQAAQLVQCGVNFVNGALNASN